MSQRKHQESSAVLRVSALPLVRSALQSVTSAFSEVKGRFPLLALMGGVAEVGVRSASHAAMTRATPLLQSLQPQIEVANSLALVGLERLEKNFPVLHQSTDEVLGHLKDALFLTLDDVQLWLLDGVDAAVDQLERAVRLLQDMPGRRAAAMGLDNALSYLEDATAYYLPLTPQLRVEWERRVKEFDDEEEDDEEPSVWTRLRSLLLSLSLQLYDGLLTLGDTLHNAAHKVGLGWVVQAVWELLQNLQRLLVALAYRAERLRELTLSELRGVMELSQMLLQLVINGTPLYNMLQQPSAQEVEDFLNQDFTAHGLSHRSSANSLFLKAMDGRPHRRRSRAARGSVEPQTPDPPNCPQRSSLKELMALMVEEQPLASGADVHRRPSATELLLLPLKESQKVFDNLSPDNTDDAGKADTDNEKAEIAESENAEKAEIAESENVEKAEIAETENAEIAESENAEKAEMAESENAEIAEIAETSYDKKDDNADVSNDEKADNTELLLTPPAFEDPRPDSPDNGENDDNAEARLSSRAAESSADCGLKAEEPSIVHRRPSAAELLLAPLKQFVSQSQKVFELLSPNAENVESAETDEDAERLLEPLKEFVSQSQKAFELLSPDNADNAEKAEIEESENAEIEESENTDDTDSGRASADC